MEYRTGFRLSSLIKPWMQFSCTRLFKTLHTQACAEFQYGAQSPAVLEFRVATPAIVPPRTVVISLDVTGQSQGPDTTWNSGSASSVTLSLINRNTAFGGKHFAVDDTYFGTESTLPPVPETETYALMALGLVALAATIRRKDVVR